MTYLLNPHPLVVLMVVGLVLVLAVALDELEV